MKRTKCKATEAVESLLPSFIRPQVQKFSSELFSRSTPDKQLRQIEKQERDCAYKRSNEGRSRDHSCRGKAINTVTYSECVSVALVVQQEKRMRRIILSSEACPPVPCFYALSYKRHDFRGKNY